MVTETPVPIELEAGRTPEAIWTFGEEENPCTLSEKEPPFIGHPAQSLVTTQTTLYQLFKWMLN
jgi:hypothetical protein